MGLMGNISNIRTEVKMLSRQAITRATQARNCLVVASRGLAVSTPNPERDLVNYPARVRPIEKAPVRMGIFPEEWFAALYPKTGVTGPYMFLAGVGTFLCSKEFFVMEHDFYVGVVCSLFSPLLSSRLVQTGLHLSIKNLMMRKLLLDLSGSPRLTSARMLLHKRSLVRPILLPGRILLLLRRKLLVCSWRECTGLGCSLPTLRSRRGWTTSWRLPTL